MPASHGEAWGPTAPLLVVRFEEEGTISPVLDDRGSTVAYVSVKRDPTREWALGQALSRRDRPAPGRAPAAVAAPTTVSNTP